MVSVLVTGLAFLVVVPQPESGRKQGSTRASAVPSGTVATETRSDAKVQLKTDVKIIGASAESRKPCDEQTWPYIEQHCLTRADDKVAKNNKSVPPPLGLRDMLAGFRPVPDDALTAPANGSPAADQPVGSVTAIVPTPPIEQMQANTVGAGVNEENSALAEATDVPLPTPRPEIAAIFSASEDTGVVPSSAVPLSRSEQRQLQREQRRAEREQRRLERAERRTLDPGRIVRRWTEYSYDNDSRVIVIQQGSRRDPFFRNYR